MTQLVTITSQGQITIPVAFRRQLGLDQFNQARVTLQNNTVILEPVPDFLSLGGSLKKYAKNAKGKTFKQMRVEFENYLATRYLTRGNFPFPHVSP